MIGVSNNSAVVIALFGIIAASLRTALSFATAWLIAITALITTKLYRKLTGRPDS